MKALLIDDDYKACANLKIMLAEYCPDVEVIGEAHHLKNAVPIIESSQPALLFLDMQMDGEHGFDLFSLTDLSTTQVIIVSAFEEFAIRAFKFSAIDYLLKPINPKDLVKAVAKSNEEQAGGKNSLHSLIELLKNNQKPSFNRIGIPTVFGSVFIDIKNVIRCEADRNYTKIFIRSNLHPIMSSKNLSSIAELFPDEQFVRVHHSHLVNINYIKEFHRGKQASLILDNGDEVQISQNKKTHLLERLNIL